MSEDPRPITISFGEPITVTLPDRETAKAQMLAEGVPEEFAWMWEREREEDDRIEAFGREHIGHTLRSPLVRHLSVEFPCSCGASLTVARRD